MAGEAMPYLTLLYHESGVER